MEVLSIVLVTLLIGVAVGGTLARIFSPRTALYGSFVMFGIAVVLLLVGWQREGFDALGYTIPALVLCVPMGVSMGLVALLAMYGRRR